MRLTGTCIVVAGLALLSRPALAQSVGPNEEQGQALQAPGVHAWLGRLPSKTELQTLFSEARSGSPSPRPSGAEQPDFQNERVKVYVGRLPPLESRKDVGAPPRRARSR
jgi:hypothetical protein